MSEQTGTVIGTITITETTRYTRRNYETASWYKILDLHPGTYEVRATYRWNECGCERDQNGRRVPGAHPAPKDMHITIPGTVVDENFPSSFFGVAIGGPTEKRDIGKVETVSIHLYGYMAANIAEYAPGEGTTFELADGFEVIPAVLTREDEHRAYGAHAVRMADVEAFNQVHTRHPIHLCEATCAA